MHVDPELMAELGNVAKAASPDETLLVCDAMTGQDAVNVAESFLAEVDLTGIILTKLDGDARGGAALSMSYVTGRPIKFAGVGEKLGDLEPFHPDRMASRILGHGRRDDADREGRIRLRSGRGQEDGGEASQGATSPSRTSSSQMQALKKMGPMSQVLGMIPGMSKLPAGTPISTLSYRRSKRSSGR